MRGEPDSCGVWAPSLSYADGLFWLIYTDMKRYDGNYKDSHNYLVTSPSIEGPWSDGIRLNSSGFDPSLFHDADGRKWFVNMDWDYRGVQGGRGDGFFSGIVMQEYDPVAKSLVGPITRIFEGTERGVTEAPHLYQRDGWYYLITAEGGTGYDHAVTHARSRNIEGPYELHPMVHPLIASKSKDAPLQRIGHGQFIEDDDGAVWHTFLCGRPLPGTQRSPLGRESGITQMEWRDDGWLYPLEMPAVAVDGFAEDHQETRFEDGLPLAFQWLRSPERDRLFSTTARPDALRLFGRESIGSWFEQSLVARRQTGWRYSAETLLEFDPVDYQTQAGLVAYYNRHQFHYLFVSRNNAGARVLGIQTCPGVWPEGWVDLPLGDGVIIADGPIRLGVDVDLETLQFWYALDGGDKQTIGPVLDASILSDEAGRGEHACFTGAFVGMAAQDVSGRAHPADFGFFSYRNRQNALK